LQKKKKASLNTSNDGIPDGFLRNLTKLGGGCKVTTYFWWVVQRNILREPERSTWRNIYSLHGVEVLICGVFQKYNIHVKILMFC